MKRIVVVGLVLALSSGVVSSTPAHAAYSATADLKLSWFLTQNSDGTFTLKMAAENKGPDSIRVFSLTLLGDGIRVVKWRFAHPGFYKYTCFKNHRRRIDLRCAVFTKLRPQQTFGWLDVTIVGEPGGWFQGCLRSRDSYDPHHYNNRFGIFLPAAPDASMANPSLLARTAYPFGCEPGSS